ncbi:MAG TPA: transcription antitermination factor NusB, partial [Rhodothermales bacterium]|nr:transcription antitermination factor NusB [Rhodothermales bacterium]
AVCVVRHRSYLANRDSASGELFCSNKYWSNAMSKRRHARERVLQALYAHALGGGDSAHIIRTVIEPRIENDAVTFGFARDLFLKCLDREQEAFDIIRDHVQNWDLSRVAIVDRLVIQIAIVEFLYLEDVPPKVTMNELIEVAKKYSTLDSGKFVNGVLDAVLSSLVESGRIKKKGRGLVGMDYAGRSGEAGE